MPKTWSNQESRTGLLGCKVVGRGLCSKVPKTWSIIRRAELGLWAAGRWREGGCAGGCAPRFRHFGRLKVRKHGVIRGAELGFWAAGEVVGRGLCSAFSALWRVESAENME